MRLIFSLEYRRLHYHRWEVRYRCTLLSILPGSLCQSLPVYSIYWHFSLKTVVVSPDSDNRACLHWNYLLMYRKFPMLFIQYSVKIWLAAQQSVRIRPYLLRCVPYLRIRSGLPVKYQCPCRPTGFRVYTCLDCTAPMLEKSDKLYADCLYVMAFNSWLFITSMENSQINSK